MKPFIKGMLVISILSQLVSGCGFSERSSHNVTSFDWDATDSAPDHYPMEIINGTFIYKDEKALGLYIPSGGTIDDGWGTPISSHSTGEKYKPLPDKLDIYFFSYAEKQFYHGKFNLPYDKILALFQAGVAVDPNHPVITSIMAGIAPGGAVAVWVVGRGDYTEVFFGQADKVDLDPSAAFALPFEDKQDVENYMQEGLEEMLDANELADLKKNGIPFGLWARYRHQYHWQPTAAKGFVLENVSVAYLNGEYLDKWQGSNQSDNLPAHPAPRWITFKATVNGHKRLFTITFDEFEIMDAFEKLGKDNQKVYLEFEPHLPREDTRVRIYNDKESITLKKYKSKK